MKAISLAVAFWVLAALNSNSAIAGCGNDITPAGGKKPRARN